MAVLLMKLRYVPDDELAEISALLEQHALDFYATTAGTFGISLPALWLVDAGKLEQAKALLEDYARQRQNQARAMHEAMKDAGTQRTALDILRENPLRFVLYSIFVLALIYISLVPFFTTF